jgi:hypothetical protein
MFHRVPHQQRALIYRLLRFFSSSGCRGRQRFGLGLVRNRGLQGLLVADRSTMYDVVGVILLFRIYR